MTRKIGRAVLGSYLAALALVAFWPTPVDKPFASVLSQLLRDLHRHGVPGWFNYNFVEASANVVLFIPFGVLVALLLPRNRWWLAIAAGLTASCAIELGQALFLAARFASLNDVAMNTLGAVLGAVCVPLARTLRSVATPVPARAERA